MRKLSYPLGALVALLVSSSALAQTDPVPDEELDRPADVVEVDDVRVSEVAGRSAPNDPAGEGGRALASEDGGGGAGGDGGEGGGVTDGEGGGGGADGEGGDDAAGGIDIGRVYGSDGCNLASTPRAGVNAALALLGLAMASFAVRMQPRRARARLRAERRQD
jgi:hypothetical protein